MGSSAMSSGQSRPVGGAGNPVHGVGSAHGMWGYKGGLEEGQTGNGENEG